MVNLVRLNLSFELALDFECKRRFLGFRCKCKCGFCAYVVEDAGRAWLWQRTEWGMIYSSSSFTGEVFTTLDSLPVFHPLMARGTWKTKKRRCCSAD